jgi:hypothetical protein
VQNNFATALGGETEIVLAPTPWRWRRGLKWEDYCCGERPRRAKPLAPDP